MGMMARDRVLMQLALVGMLVSVIAKSGERRYVASPYEEGFGIDMFGVSPEFMGPMDAMPSISAMRTQGEQIGIQPGSGESRSGESRSGESTRCLSLNIPTDTVGCGA
eukprot:721010-Amorphochlora_amoeboformis.AAC.2